MKKILVYLVLVVLIFTGCGSAPKEAATSETATESVTEMKAERNEDFGDSVESLPAGRKIIMNADVTLRVSDYSESAQAIEDAVMGIGGYVSRSTVNENHAYLVVKVPQGHTKGFVNSLANFGSLVESNFTSEDVTDQFTDLEIRIKNLEVQITTLRSLLLKEDIKVEDIFKIESEIRRLTNELEGYKGSLRSLDAQVSFSEVRISFIKESTVHAPPTEDFGYELKATFDRGVNVLIEFCQGIVLIVAFFIPLLPLVLILAIVGFVVYKRMKRNEENRSDLSKRLDSKRDGNEDQED